MDTVRLGKTGLTVSKNGFGALPVQRVSMEEGCRLLRKAYENGFNYFDTARVYTDSEEKIGRALGSVREKIVISTKTTAKTAEKFWEDLHTSLSLLQTDYIDIYQLHNPAFCPRPGDESGLYDAMLEAQAKGMIRHIGITNHRLKVAMEAAESGLYETVQFPFSYLASREETELVRLCAEKDVGFICMKALAGGLITNSRAAYAYLSQYPVAPIWGIQRECELDEFIAYQDAPPRMDDELRAFIEKERRELQGDFCRGCGYCMPCPQEIEINTCARISLMIRRSPEAGYRTEHMRQKMEKVASCLGCNLCVSRCPYGLDTPVLLRKNLEFYREYLKNLQ